MLGSGRKSGNNISAALEQDEKKQQKVQETYYKFYSYTKFVFQIFVCIHTKSPLPEDRISPPPALYLYRTWACMYMHEHEYTICLLGTDVFD